MLFADSAVAGEGAAFAIGLLMLGQSESLLAQQVLPDLLNYLHDTAHEKIIRSLSLSIAMMVYGKEEGADIIIEQLSADRDPIVRYGAMYAIAMAYCGWFHRCLLRHSAYCYGESLPHDLQERRTTALCGSCCM